MGEEVSGGQKAEYLFQREIKNASSYDIVLIDEPESSFDNPFLNEAIAKRLKDISAKTTVFVATHNNVLGASIKPDAIICTTVDGLGKHDVFAGEACSHALSSISNKTICRSTIMMKFLEAGEDAYNEGKPYYADSDD